MSAYENFVQDFPGRCLDVLDKAGKQTQWADRKVTLLLMAASAGIVVPYERLKQKAVNSEFPRVTTDEQQYPEASEALAKLLKQKFLDSSDFWGSDEPGDWYAGADAPPEWPPDGWPYGMLEKSMTKNKTIGWVVYIIRNSLAHGNFCSRGKSIDLLVFASGNYSVDKKTLNGLSYVAVAPKAFERFLYRWFEFLRGLKLPEFVPGEEAA